MTQQSVTSTFYGTGIPGEFANSDNQHTEGRLLNSDTESLNVPGAVVVNYQADDANQVGVAGDGNVAGILGFPKIAVRDGLANLGYVTNGQQVDIIKRGYVFVTLETTAAKGDFVYYNTTTGAISTFAPDTAPDSGYVRIPGGKVAQFEVTAAGLGVIYVDFDAGSTETPSA